MLFDLHVHTNFSDGDYSPEEVVNKAVNKGLTGIAITDHDTVSGINIASKHADTYNNFYVIPGIEFGTLYNDEEVHILGYFIDYKNSVLLDIIQRLKSSRMDRAIKIVAKLKELGMPIDIQDVLAYSSADNIGRPHIARALIGKNYVNSIQEAFDLYLERGKPAYCERYHLSIEETIQLIHSIDGISVLAHPGLLRDKSIINYAIKEGVDGIECIHSKHTGIETDTFINIAKKNNLIITGGSDYHGNPEILGDFYVNLDDIPEMKERVLNV